MKDRSSVLILVKDRALLAGRVGWVAQLPGAWGLGGLPGWPSRVGGSSVLSSWPTTLLTEVSPAGTARQASCPGLPVGELAANMNTPLGEDRLRVPLYLIIKSADTVVESQKRAGLWGNAKWFSVGSIIRTSLGVASRWGSSR